MKSVIEKFSKHTDYLSLHGGQGKSIKAGKHVIKPIHTHEFDIYQWYAETFEKHNFSGIGYSKPVRSRYGYFIEDGHGATEFLTGAFYVGRMEEKLNACKTFHRLLKDIPKPQKFDSWINPWTKAQDLAWGKIKISRAFHPEVKSILKGLFACWKKIDLPTQLIHTDFAGNILFDADKPVIIDFTAGYFPKEYAKVLLVSDSIAWFNEPTESLGLLGINEDLLFQLLIRAIIFRISWSLYFDSNNFERFMKDYNCFKKVIDLVQQKCLA